MDGDTLYRKIRLDFFQKVYSGEIKPGGQLTAERKQAQELSVSRGTIRKAREILAEEGYIASTQGSGAVYTPLVNRKSAEPEIIAVVVPVHNPFFMSYYRAFEKEAESRDYSGGDQAAGPSQRGPPQGCALLTFHERNPGYCVLAL